MANQKLASLLQLATEDLGLAAQPTTLPRHSAYLLSQAAEKAARAICEYESIPVGTTHNIGQIGALLPADHAMRQSIEAQNYLSSASTKYRYPDPAGRLPTPPTADEIKQRIDDVTAFLRETVKFVSGQEDNASSRKL